MGVADREQVAAFGKPARRQGARAAAGARQLAVFLLVHLLASVSTSTWLNMWSISFLKNAMAGRKVKTMAAGL